MPKFRKKPVEVEAIQYDGENFEAVAKLTDGAAWLGYTGAVWVPPTLRAGRDSARKDDWIIRDGDTLCVVKPDDFAATYEPLEAPREPIKKTYRVINAPTPNPLEAPLQEGDQ